jgi:hypothetical protein
MTSLPLNQETANLLWRAVGEGTLLKIAETHPLTLDHLLLKIADGNTPLHRLTAWRQLNQATKILNASGEKLRLEHFLIQDKEGVTPLHWAMANDDLTQVVETLKGSGEKLDSKHFLIEDKEGNTPLTWAAMNRSLSPLFNPSQWVGRVGEMQRLWEQVPKENQGQIDYEALRNEAIQQSVHPERLRTWNGAGMTRPVRPTEKQEDQRNNEVNRV